MEELIEKLIKWGGYAGMVVLGVLAYVFPARKKELNTATQELIQTLQETVNALKDDLDLHKKKVEDMEHRQSENIKAIEALTARNNLLEDIFKGRDESTKKFQEQCLQGLEVTHKTLMLVEALSTLIKELGDGMKENNTMTKEFVATMKTHLLNVERAAIK